MSPMLMAYILHQTERFPTSPTFQSPGRVRVTSLLTAPSRGLAGMTLGGCGTMVPSSVATDPLESQKKASGARPSKQKS